MEVESERHERSAAPTEILDPGYWRASWPSVFGGVSLLATLGALVPEEVALGIGAGSIGGGADALCAGAAGALSIGAGVLTGAGVAIGAGIAAACVGGAGGVAGAGLFTGAGVGAVGLGAGATRVVVAVEVCRELFGAGLKVAVSTFLVGSSVFTGAGVASANVVAGLLPFVLVSATFASAFRAVAVAFDSVSGLLVK